MLWQVTAPGEDDGDVGNEKDDDEEEEEDEEEVEDVDDGHDHDDDDSTIVRDNPRGNQVVKSTSG